MRLSAHTAIQFYDVQDRLGYDRPSKAVDWLINKAKAAIDELDELPAWNPMSSSSAAAVAANQPLVNENAPAVDTATIASSSRLTSSTTAVMATLVGDSRVSDCSGGLTLQNHMVNHEPNTGTGAGGSGFLPASLDSDAIADTIKSFFPDHPHPPQSSTTIQFHQSYPPDLLSRTSSQSQDLRLSLQSFQDPTLLHHQAQVNRNEQALFSGTGFIGSFSAGWSDHHHHQQGPAEMNPYQRNVAWSGGDTTTGNGGNVGATGSGGESVGFIFNSLPAPSPSPSLQPFVGRNQFFTQRGPLQSSTTPSIRAWIDPSSLSMADHQISHAIHHHHQQHHNQSSMSAMGFVSGGFSSGFHVPAQIQGEEEHDGISEKPSSASSDSRH